MKKFLRLLLLAIITCLALGQLTRLTLTPQIAFYFHDLLIVVFLIFSFAFLRPNFSRLLILWRRKLNAQPRWLLILALALSCIFLFQTFSHLLSALYFLRFLTYLIFAFTVYRLRLFSAAEWQKIFTVFFLASAIIGLGQYCLFPDPSYLENFGWDDHRYRLIGTWLDPAFTSLIYVFGLIYFAQIIFKKLSPKHFAFSLFAILTLTIALFLTYSRSSFLAILVVGAIFLWQKTKIYRFKKIASPLKLRPLFIFFITLFLLATIYFIFIFQAQNHPTDSTNLLRSNSLNIRITMIKTQFSSFSLKTWLVGNGFFATNFSSSPIPFSSSPAKQTLPVPDNFFVLLLSFVGLPLTIIIVLQLGKILLSLWQHQRLIFYLSLALLLNAQFNQAVFQPFVLLTFLLICAALPTSLPPPNSRSTHRCTQDC